MKTNHLYLLSLECQTNTRVQRAQVEIIKRQTVSIDQI